MKYLFTFLFLVSASLGFSQNAITKEELNEDLAYLKKILYTNHPSPFLYTKKDSLDPLFSSLRFNDTDKISKLALEKRVRIILSAIGCIHTSITKPVSYAGLSVIPFDVFTNGQSIWIRESFSDSLDYLVGSQLLSINHNSSQKIINKMKPFFPSDGYNQSFKIHALNNKGRFRNLYNYYFDTDSLKTITAVLPNHDTVVQSIKNIPFETKTKKRTDGLKFGAFTTLKFDTIHQVAIIKITSFNLKGSFRKANKRYKRLIQLIHQNGIKSVVLDLRDNLGGDATNANLLLSHFIASDHLIDKERMKNKSFRYSITSSKFVSSLDVVFKSLFRKKIRTDSSIIINTIIAKNEKSHFDGQLFILVNGFSASASSNVASILKHTSQAIVIGQETGGAEEQFNAFFSPRYKLPNSKIILKIPKYRIHLHTTENKGSGVLPNYNIKYSIQDVINKKDLEYQQVIRLLGF